MRIRPGIVGALLLFSGAWGGELTEITVDVANPKGNVRHTVFGHNIECSDNRGVFSLPADAPEPRDLEVKYGMGFWDPVKDRCAPGAVEAVRQVPFGALRYPGGCLAHNFRWKESIGPIEKRGASNWAFGLDEYLKLCREIGCEPQIIVTDYALPVEEIPQDAADLVEYLNMPATSQYPWAVKRASHGHPEPYGVHYFELGNESEHGNHAGKPTRRFSAEDYVRYFNATAAAMKKIDPTIQLGAQAVPGDDDHWSDTVMKNCAKLADFFIIHSYYPQVDSLKPEAAFKGVMAGNTQFLQRLNECRSVMKSAGMERPLAVTEFNIRSTAGKRDAYRYSYLAGMQCAELWSLFAQPENKILLANYWLLLNGMYGVISTIGGKEIPRDYSGRVIERKAALAFFQTLKRFGGEIVLPVAVRNAPGIEAPASPGVQESRGDVLVPQNSAFESCKLPKFDLKKLQTATLSATGNAEEGVLTVNFKGQQQDYYPPFAVFRRPASTPTGAWQAEVSFEARFVPAAENAGAATIGFGMMDVRGWNATHCAKAIYAINTSREFTRFSARLDLLSDSPGVALLVRMQHFNGKVSGSLEIRDLKIAVRPSGHFPAYPGVSAFADRSEDGKTVNLIVFNRSFERALPIRIDLKGFSPVSAVMETLFRPNPGQVEYFEPERKTFDEEALPFAFTLPPHSMTAIAYSSEPVKNLQLCILGNSLRHHVPKPQIGWKGNWGMAATAPEKDYVHLLHKKLEKAAFMQGIGSVKLSLPNGAVQEKDWQKFDTDAVRDADILIIQLGDNFRKGKNFNAERDFIDPYAKMILAMKERNPEALIFCVSNWSGGEMSRWIAEGAERGGAGFIPLGDLGQKKENRAGSEGHFTNNGVNWHPGDRGMEAIAERIWSSIAPVVQKKWENRK